MDNNETLVRNDREKKLRRKKIRRTILTILLIVLVIAGIWVYNYRISKGVFPWQEEKSSSSTQTMSKTTIREETYVTSIDVSGSVVAYDTQKVQMRSSWPAVSRQATARHWRNSPPLT